MTEEQITKEEILFWKNKYEQEEDLYNKEIEGVVVYSLSRWGRSVRENWESIDLMTKSDIGFYSVKEMVDTSSSMGKFLLGVMNCMYQLEIEQLSERTKDVLPRNIKCFWNNKS